MTILFYPQDVIAVNPKLKGFDATTYNPVFYPTAGTHWTIDGAGVRRDGGVRLLAAAKFAGADVHDRLP